MSSEELTYDGCNFIRQRLTFSILSGRPVLIRNIRKDSDEPGIKDYESKLLSLLEKVTNGTRIEINKTGTQVLMKPGMITGGVVNMDCGVQRCISYFLEPILMLAPFCKVPMRVKLTGVTNAPGELSVDAVKTAWLNVFNKFILNDENLDLKIIRRGLLPEGGGQVVFSAPIVKVVRPIQREKPGKVCKIRGMAYVTKVSPSLAHRMIEAAKKAMHGYISDVYITVDQRKGDAGGKSPGFGLFLTAETTEGVFYHGEAISNPKGSQEPSVPDDVGVAAAQRLLMEIYRGGCCDSSAQAMTATLMSLGDKDVSKCLFGPLSLYTMHALRHLRDYFETTFKIDEWAKVGGKDKAGDDDEEDDLQLGSTEKAMMTCVGAGFSNLNKIVL